jgi:DNA-binding CsgD family transcriptional regulator
MRVEDADLVAEMHRSAGQFPPWDGFLRSFITRLGAQMASVIIQGPDPHRQMAIFAHPKGTDQPSTENLRLMRYQRIYTGADFAHTRPFRALRMRLQGGGDAWAIVQKEGADFAATASAVLTLIADNFALACLRYLSDMSAQVISQNMAEVLRRLGLAWAVVDAGMAIVATGGNLPQGAVQSNRLYLPQAIMAKLTEGLRIGTFPPIAVQEGGVQYLAMPQPNADRMARAIIYMQTPRDFAAPVPVLAQFTGLTPTEARFVLQLTTGKTIAQAGQALNLTPETARYYSKQAYAKLPSPNQTALMRQIETSVLRLL